MLAIPLFLAAGSLFTVSSGAPLQFSHFTGSNAASTHSLQERGSDSYIVYGGNGQVSVGWPSMNKWVSDYETMWSANTAIMKSSCAAWGVPNNSDDEIANIKSGIESASSSSGIDKRFILAILMQESNGCVRVPTTNWGVRNPGLMQDHDGSATCNEGGVQNPCPKDTIAKMISEGVSGTSAGDGLKQTLQQGGGNLQDATTYYKAARIYNSGSIDSSGNLGAGVATHCYASDVANRLTGWVNAAKTCVEASVGALTGSAGSSGNDDTTNNSPSSAAASSVPASTANSAPTTTVKPSVVVQATSAPVSSAQATSAPVSSAVASSAVASTKAPTPTTFATATSAPVSTATSSPSQPTAEKAPGAASNCQKWYTVQNGDYCEKVEQANGLSSGTLQKYNTQLDSSCSNLWLGYAYCISA